MSFFLSLCSNFGPSYFIPLWLQFWGQPSHAGTGRSHHGPGKNGETLIELNDVMLWVSVYLKIFNIFYKAHKKGNSLKKESKTHIKEMIPNQIWETGFDGLQYKYQTYQKNRRRVANETKETWLTVPVALIPRDILRLTGKEKEGRKRSHILITLLCQKFWNITL